ncbi:MAG: NUDIX hydrolase [Rhodobacteraceae bacterium]|nr:NUDIX hydrolase [Paracoccaceae bacterium]
MTVKPWKTLSSQLLVDDRWMRLRADVCERDDGMIIEPFYVQESRDWVCVFPVTQSGDVVLVTEYRHAVGKVVTGLCGGVVDDEAPLEAAKRELLEETGYGEGEWTALGALYSNWGTLGNRIHYFLATDLRFISDQNLDDTEEIDVVTKPLAEVRKPGALEQSFHVACLHLALAHLDSGKS